MQKASDGYLSRSALAKSTGVATHPLYGGLAAAATLLARTIGWYRRHLPAQVVSSSRQASMLQERKAPVRQSPTRGWCESSRSASHIFAQRSVLFHTNTGIDVVTRLNRSYARSGITRVCPARVEL